MFRRTIATAAMLAVGIATLAACSKTQPAPGPAPKAVVAANLQKQMDDEFRARVAAERHQTEAASGRAAEEARNGQEGELEQQLKQRLLHELKDPSSAQFRNVRVAGGALCGEVNAKNSFGGYTGFSPFVVDGEAAAIARPKNQDLTAYAVWYEKASRYGCA